LHEDTASRSRRGWWGFTEGIYNRVLQFYEWTLRGVLRHPLFTVAISLILAVFTFYLFGAVPKGFIPPGDTASLFGNTEGAQGISLDDMIKHQNAITEVLKKDPNIQSYASTVGAGGRNSGGNSGTIFIGLKPLNQRKSADEGDEELPPERFAREPGLRVILQNPPS
jgi:HAE1 family hydrophobic/amphiphilic exporter-1